jgi:hypothetical protein
VTDPQKPNKGDDDEELNLTLDGNNVDGDDFQKHPVSGDLVLGIDDSTGKSHGVIVEDGVLKHYPV